MSSTRISQEPEECRWCFSAWNIVSEVFGKDSSCSVPRNFKDFRPKRIAISRTWEVNIYHTLLDILLLSTTYHTRKCPAHVRVDISKNRKWIEMTVRIQWHIGAVWGAKAMKEVVRYINEWASGGVDDNETTWKNLCTRINERMSQWIDELPNQCISDWLNHWSNEALIIESTKYE